MRTPRFHPIVSLASAILSSFAASSATSGAEPPSLSSVPDRAVVRLWETEAPGARGEASHDIPTLTVYPADPAQRTAASMLVLPGGGYRHLADHEGRGYAEWFAQHGLTAYVLKYRLGSNGYRHPTMLHDAARALRLVRSLARKSEGLDPARIGVIGSSAGGHLASTLATHFDLGAPSAADPIERESSRPDLAVLCYPVISFGEFAHAGSRRELLGENPPPESIKKLSTEFQVTKDTPPTFIWHTVEDKTVPVENALLFASALRRANVPFSLHVYETGAHGLGLGRPGRPAPPWADQLLYWFKERKFIAE